MQWGSRCMVAKVEGKVPILPATVARSPRHPTTESALQAVCALALLVHHRISTLRRVVSSCLVDDSVMCVLAG